MYFQVILCRWACRSPPVSPRQHKLLCSATVTSLFSLRGEKNKNKAAEEVWSSYLFLSDAGRIVNQISDREKLRLAWEVVLSRHLLQP